ncbi:hypothetical protein JL720_2498 [Aureococcus anophagefferens]|nr:hypothetical protein JL720_2498 [Aureococcus anophagefferens]
MRLASLLLVAAWSAAAKPTPKVIYVNLDNDEVLAIQRLVEEETGSRWAAVAGAWGRYRLALFEQGDLDRLGVDGAELLARLTAEWTRNKKSLRPLIFTSRRSSTARATTSSTTSASAPVDAAAGGDAGRTTAPALLGSTAEGAEVLVLDGFADDELRRALLGLLHGPGVDPYASPDPDFWERGAVRDRASDQHGQHGLRPERLLELCATPPEAPTPPPIAELQRRLLALVAAANPAGGVLARVSYQLTPPDAAFGVSPCVANAVLPGDRHGFHDDADPAKLPPSAWTDAYGHYANRSPGTPRFLSALIYLNEFWDDAWGGATRLRARRKRGKRRARHADVEPRPGRLLLMDQDVAHALGRTNGTAPPRYSLVLKLVLHPRDDPETGARFDASRRMEFVDIARFGLPVRLDLDGGAPGLAALGEL